LGNAKKKKITHERSQRRRRQGEIPKENDRLRLLKIRGEHEPNRYSLIRGLSKKSTKKKEI